MVFFLFGFKFSSISLFCFVLGKQNRKGALTSMDNGVVTSYALQLLEPRGVLFVGPGTEVYEVNKNYYILFF